MKKALSKKYHEEQKLNEEQKANQKPIMDVKFNKETLVSNVFPNREYGPPVESAKEFIDNWREKQAAAKEAKKKNSTPSASSSKKKRSYDKR